MSRIMMAAGAWFLLTGTAMAQTCLHGASEAPEQRQRRQAALASARTINNIQHNRPEARQGTFLAHEELAAAPFAAKLKATSNSALQQLVLAPNQDIVPGWRLTLDVSKNGYWFGITDTTDPCQFTFISNQSGLIYTAEPLR